MQQRKAKHRPVDYRSFGIVLAFSPISAPFILIVRIYRRLRKMTFLMAALLIGTIGCMLQAAILFYIGMESKLWVCIPIAVFVWYCYESVRTHKLTSKISGNKPANYVYRRQHS
jgi:hypothetical protein